MQSEIRLQLLKPIEQNPAWTQRQLANTLSVSLGKTNYCLRNLKEKGWVKWGNFSQNPNKLSFSYQLTTQGITQKLFYAAHLLKRKQGEYNQFQAEIRALREELSTRNLAENASLIANERDSHNWRASDMSIDNIIASPKIQLACRLVVVGRDRLIELMGEAIYKRSLGRRIDSEAPEQALSGLMLNKH